MRCQKLSEVLAGLEVRESEMTTEEIIEDHYRHNFNNLSLRYYRRTGSKEAGEDIVQEAYLRALTYKKAYNGSKDFDFWFSRILVNAFNDYRNSEKNHVYEEFDEDVVEGTQETGYYNILRDDLLSGINEYDGEVKEALELYFIHGYSPKQIRRLVSIKYCTINQAIYRFKLGLKEGNGERMGGGLGG